jgi:hypothetical protein
MITDEQLSIKQALKDLNQAGLFHGKHYHDSYHILKNLKSKTSK